jgi:serine-type D-Ala-D-Ala carboxypeptidase/endopeptidase (penicillin-binding protein 4)
VVRERALHSAFLFLAVAGLLVPQPVWGWARYSHSARRLPIGRQIEMILKQAGADRGSWGIEVARLPDGKILYQRDANHLMHPASNMKLFTTAAALELVGPNFIFRTTVETGKLPDAAGRVGDLVLVGRGDANLGNRVLPYHLQTERKGPYDAVIQQLADQVKSRGVREVTGNLIVDDRYFVYEPYGDNWGIEDMVWGYGAPVTAVTFNDNEVLLHIYPAEKAGDPAVVMLDPTLDSLHVLNRVGTVETTGKTRIFVERLPGSAELDLWGQIALGRGVYEDTLAIPDPPLVVGEILRRALEARGITVRGDVEVLELRRMDATGALPSFSDGRGVLAGHDSLPLREDIKLINKVSQNLHCEMLLRTLGQVTSGEGSPRAGLDALESFLSQAGVDSEDFYLTDGSGLSRTTLVAPEAVVKLLEFMAGAPHFQDYFDSLPVAGQDGLLADRFKGTRAEGMLRAKTGTLTHVNALSGYMDLPSGTRLAFSILGNDYVLHSDDGARTIDEIAVAIYDKFAGPPARRKRKSSR